MARTGGRLTRVGAALVLGVVVQLLAGLPAASAAPRATTTNSAPATSATTATTATTAASTTTAGPTTTTVPRECHGVKDENVRGGLHKSIVGGDETIGLSVIQIDTPRPPGTYHVVDCWSLQQDAPHPTVFTATDLGDREVSGTATIRTQIPFQAVPGDNTCDQVVMTGRAGGKSFRDVSNVVCTIYSSCLYAPECPQHQPPPSSAPASTGAGTLPFTGSNDPRPLLIAAVVLLGVGAASLLAARRRYG
jgi:hypothetical protein